MSEREVRGGITARISDAIGVVDTQRHLPGTLRMESTVRGSAVFNGSRLNDSLAPAALAGIVVRASFAARTRRRALALRVTER